MKLRLFSLVRASAILALLLTLALSGLPPATAQARPDAVRSAASDPFTPIFIENAGQFPAAARFQVRGQDTILWLAEDALWLTVLGPGVGLGADPAAAMEEGVHVKLTFPGANPHPHLEPFNRLDTHVSFFTGSDPARWRANVPVWGGVRYVELYPGLDLELAGAQGRLLPRLVARPGADLSAVRLRVEGADVVTLEGSALRLVTVAGALTWPLLGAEGSITAASVRAWGPLAFDVTSPFAPATGALPPYASSARSPADDPADLLYSTFLGGSAQDHGSGIVVDGSGAAYVTSLTGSTDFPTTPGAFDTSKGGGEGYYDAYVARLSPDGSALEYATFLGGSDQEYGHSVAIDDSGAAYVTGKTWSSDFPTTTGAYDTSFNGGSGDAFVVRLSPDGSALAYATFLGGSDEDESNAIVVLGNREAYVAGGTKSADWPTTLGALDTALGGESDGFVARLSADGTALAYATFLGGSGADGIAGMAVRNGEVYVAGFTGSSDLATTGAFDTSLGGDTDGFVGKLNADGSALDYATLLGGSDVDSVAEIVVAQDGMAYVVGQTLSADLATTPGAFDTTFAGFSDGFVVSLNAAGSGLGYATFLGGSDQEAAVSIAMDARGAAYVTGMTTSSDLAITSGAFDTSFNGGWSDAFVVVLDAGGGALDYATYWGGSGDEDGRAITVNGTGEVYVTGTTTSSDLPTTPAAFDTSYGGAQDAFVARLTTTYSISGRVTDTTGQGIVGVIVAAELGGSAVTNANGDYVITHVLSGTHTVTPVSVCYSFDPVARSVSVPPDATGQDFVGQPTECIRVYLPLAVCH